MINCLSLLSSCLAITIASITESMASVIPPHRRRNRGGWGPPIFLEGGLSPPNILGREAEPPSSPA